MPLGSIVNRSGIAASLKLYHVQSNQNKEEKGEKMCDTDELPLFWGTGAWYITQAINYFRARTL